MPRARDKLYFRAFDSNSKEWRLLESKIKTAKNTFAVLMDMPLVDESDEEEYQAFEADIEDVIYRAFIIHHTIDQYSTGPTVRHNLKKLITLTDEEILSGWPEFDPPTRVIVEDKHPSGHIWFEGNAPDPTWIKRTATKLLKNMPARGKGRPTESKNEALHFIAKQLPRLWQHSHLPNPEGAFTGDQLKSLRFYPFAKTVYELTPSDWRSKSSGYVPKLDYWIRQALGEFRSGS